MKKILLVMAAFIFSATLHAQLGKTIKQQVKDSVNNRSTSTVDEGINKTLSGVRNGIGGLFKKKKKKAKDSTQVSRDTTLPQSSSLKPIVNRGSQAIAANYSSPGNDASKTVSGFVPLFSFVRKNIFPDC